MDWLQPTCQGYLLRLLVSPGASRTEICGPQGDHLKIRVAAPASKGAANAALLHFLAHRLQLPKNRLTLKSGSRDRHKIVEVNGLEPELRERLTELWPSPLNGTRPGSGNQPDSEIEDRKRPARRGP